MKKVLLSLGAALLFAACNTQSYVEYKDVQNTSEDYPVIPLPAEMQMNNGRFLVDDQTRIIAPDPLRNEAEFLMEILSDRESAEIPILSEGEEPNRGIYLRLDQKVPNPEGYILDVSYDRIVVTGKTPQGIFYGIQTLRMLTPAKAEIGTAQEISIPAVHIEDEPRYSYRGMHLDVGRHFFPVEFIKRYIDLIALHKMNRFHWHLTEDQGWRIEIKKYPKLTEVGAWRKETMMGKHFDPYKGDGEPYGGFYTQEEIKEVVAYASDKHVTIIPEIEMPGHSLAALTAYPELGNGSGPYEVATTWGVFEQIYAPKEKTFQFLEDVLTEVMALFPSKYIHIGGDEAPKKEWEESEQAQQVIQREGLKNEHELQSYFIQRMERFLNKHGRRIIGWDEILEGGLAPNATVMSWRGIEGGIEAAKQGHDVVMTPVSHLYFDYYQADPETEPLAIGGFNSVEEVYSFEPAPEELSSEEKEHILGAQGNLWTEYVKTPDHVEYMVLPRMSALSEVVWSPKEKTDWESFRTRLGHLAERFQVLGLNFATHALQQQPEQNDVVETQ